MCFSHRAAVRPGRGDARHGGEDDVRPKAEIDGPADVRGAEETRHSQKVSLHHLCQVSSGFVIIKGSFSSSVS